MTARLHRIVVIEDDPAIAAAVVRGLTRAGFEVDLATDGATGLAKASSPTTSLVVLDLMLPEVTGVEVLRRLPERIAAPVIVVTARTELETRVSVFGLGASDYLPKPFFVEELIARIHARLGTALSKAAIERFGDAVVDLTSRTVEVAGKRIHLTKTEFGVLAYLVRRPGRAVARSDLSATLSDDEYGNARNLDAHVARLRKKLGGSAGSITTVWGFGYRFDPRVGGRV